jgi:hypothetical protein
VAGTGNQNKTENLTRSDTGGSYQIQSVLVSKPLMQSTVANLQLFNPILVPTSNTTDGSPWWGFFNYDVNGTLKVGAMKIQWTGTNPNLRILTSTSPSWTYTQASGGYQITSMPPSLIDGANAKTLHKEGSQYQLWAWDTTVGSYGSDVSCNTSNSVTCTYSNDDNPFNGLPDPCTGGDGTIVQFGASGRPFWLNTGPPGDVPSPSSKGSGIAWWPVTSTSLGARSLVYSLVRAMPSGYDLARTFPFRWNSPGGQRFLFTSTADDSVCVDYASPWVNTYVVRTMLVNQ